MEKPLYCLAVRLSEQTDISLQVGRILDEYVSRENPKRIGVHLLSSDVSNDPLKKYPQLFKVFFEQLEAQAKKRKITLVPLNDRPVDSAMDDLEFIFGKAITLEDKAYDMGLLPGLSAELLEAVAGPEQYWHGWNLNLVSPTSRRMVREILKEYENRRIPHGDVLALLNAIQVAHAKAMAENATARGLRHFITSPFHAALLDAIGHPVTTIISGPLPRLQFGKQKRDYQRWKELIEKVREAANKTE